MSKLFFTYSAMNAGKSTLLLQAAYNYRERGMEVMLWTSAHHGQAGAQIGKIDSRIGLEADAWLFAPGLDLFSAIGDAHRGERPLSAVFLDEAQFLTHDQVWQLAKVVDELNVPVLCYGLRTDFQGEAFSGAATLLAIADTLREARTICHCGRKAAMTARVDASGQMRLDGDQVHVEKTEYVSYCRRHWMENRSRTRS